MKHRMGERLREQLEAKGIYEDDSYEVYLRYKERNTINAVADEKLSRLKEPGFYYYNFKIKGNAMYNPDKIRDFKELYTYIKSKPGLDKELGFNEYDLERLSKGEETKHLSWDAFKQPGVMQLRQIKDIDE